MHQGERERYDCCASYFTPSASSFEPHYDCANCAVRSVRSRQKWRTISYIGNAKTERLTEQATLLYSSSLVHKRPPQSVHC